jgi:DNA-binding transcriptional LysR family regulator
MKIDILGLEAFLCIAERGSFLRAAAQLNLSQTAISHRLKKLEETLGVKLFARTTREVTLTRAGTDLLPKAQKTLAELDATFEELRQHGAERNARINVACLPAFAVNYLPPILKRFSGARPGTQVCIYEAPSAGVAELVQAGQVEFGFSVISAQRWDLIIEPITSAPFVLACPAKHPFARHKSLRWSDLPGLDLIRVGKKTTIRSIIDDAQTAARVTLDWRYEVQHVETAVSMVEIGLGATIVPRIDVDLNRSRGVVAVPLRAPRLSCPFGIVSRRGTPLSAPAAELRSLLVDRLRSPL